MAALDKNRTEDYEEFGQPALDESAGRQGLVLSLTNLSQVWLIPTKTSKSPIPSWGTAWPCR
jgi:hypothetical protein